MNSRGPEGDTISLRSAAERLGVHYMTAYRYVRLGQLPATKVGGQWQIDLEDLESLVHGPSPTEPVSLATASAQLREALVSGDEVTAWRIVDGSGLEPAAIHTDLLGPAMAEVGDCWARGELTIADEHQATAVATRVMGRLGPAFARAGRKRGKAIVGAPEGDHHSLPSAFFSDLLRSEGLEVTDLGASTTTAAFCEVVRRHDGRVAVVLSVTAGGTADAIDDTVKSLRDEWPDLPIAVGGRAIPSEEAAMARGSSVWAASSTDAASAIADLAAAR